MTIQVERRHKYLIITLDRPQALNALTLDMIQDLSRAIQEIESDSSLCGGILRSSQARAYCAGGDIKKARDCAIAGDVDLAMSFFHAEYALNKQMFHCSKPLIAIMDGITMGGGVGVSAPCRYRLATERTLWAMPEVGIGFFPDVGAAYYLSRMPNKYGLYLGMTGARVDDSSLCLGLEIATHIIDFNRIDDIVDIISKGDEIEGSISQFTLDIPPKIPEIHDIQYHPSYSPLSYVVAKAHITKARNESFDDVIARDLQLAERFMQEPDFIEGVRAVVVDKDRNPKWSKALGELADFDIDQYLN